MSGFSCIVEMFGELLFNVPGFEDLGVSVSGFRDHGLDYIV